MPPNNEVDSTAYMTCYRHSLASLSPDKNNLRVRMILWSKKTRKLDLHVVVRDILVLGQR